MLDSEQKELLEMNKQNISSFILDNQNTKIQIESKTESEPIDYINKISSIYKELLDREPDIGGLKHYSNQLKYNIISEEELRNIIINSPEYKDKRNKPRTKLPLLVYCMIGGNRINEIKPYLETILPYVDKLIYIDSYSTDGSSDYIKTLDSSKVILIQKEWRDRFSEFRNYYMEYLQSTNYEGWIITSDTDEHFPLETLSQLRNLIDISSKEEYSGIQFRVEDISVDDDDQNKIISKTINNYWKSLMFKYHPALHYEGEPHETLIGHNIKWKETNLIYQHIRSKLHVYVRACENFYISNSNRYSDKWAEFRFLCTKNNLLSFKEFYKLFEKHNLPKEIEDWIYQHRDDNQDSGDSEVREMAILYNDILPKRNSKKTPVDTKDFAERLQSSVDAKNLAERLLATTTGKILKTPETPPSIPETLKIPQPAIPVITIPSVDIQINTGTNERPFYFIHQECEHCSATINLKELIINDKCNLTLCKDCWLNLVNTIHAEYKIPTK